MGPIILCGSHERCMVFSTDFGGKKIQNQSRTINLYFWGRWGTSLVYCVRCGVSEVRGRQKRVEGVVTMERVQN